MLIPKAKFSLWFGEGKEGLCANLHLSKTVCLVSPLAEENPYIDGIKKRALERLCLLDFTPDWKTKINIALDHGRKNGKITHLKISVEQKMSFNSCLPLNPKSGTCNKPKHFEKIFFFKSNHLMTNNKKRGNPTKSLAAGSRKDALGNGKPWEEYASMIHWYIHWNDYLFTKSSNSFRHKLLRQIHMQNTLALFCHDQKNHLDGLWVIW